MKNIALIFLSLFLLMSCVQEPNIKYQLKVTSFPESADVYFPIETEHNEGDLVELHAVPNDNWVFTNWSGDQVGSSNPTTIIMNQDKEIVANYKGEEFEVNVETIGSGTVIEEIYNEKNKSYEFMTQLQLTAQPSELWEFVRWEGDLTGEENPIKLTVDGPKNIEAIFERIEEFSEILYGITVDVDGSEFTFIVDLSDENDFNPEIHEVYITGGMFGWPEPGVDDTLTLEFMSSIDLYPISSGIEVEEMDYQYKYFSNFIAEGWDGGEWSGDPSRIVSIKKDSVVIDTWGVKPID